MRDVAFIAALANERFARWQQALRRGDEIAVGALERLWAEMNSGLLSKHHDWEHDERGHTYQTASARAAQLNFSERRVLQQMADGATYVSCGRVLHISPETVKSHLKAARRKLSARTTTEAVATALRGGAIS